MDGRWRNLWNKIRSTLNPIGKLNSSNEEVELEKNYEKRVYSKGAGPQRFAGCAVSEAYFKPFTWRQPQKEQLVPDIKQCAEYALFCDQSYRNCDCYESMLFMIVCKDKIFDPTLH